MFFGIETEFPVPGAPCEIQACTAPETTYVDPLVPERFSPEYKRVCNCNRVSFHRLVAPWLPAFTNLVTRASPDASPSDRRIERPRSFGSTEFKTGPK